MWAMSALDYELWGESSRHCLPRAKHRACHVVWAQLNVFVNEYINGWMCQWHRCPHDNQLAGRDCRAANLNLMDSRPTLLWRPYWNPSPLQKLPHTPFLLRPPTLLFGNPWNVPMGNIPGSLIRLKASWADVKIFFSPINCLQIFSGQYKKSENIPCKWKIHQSQFRVLPTRNDAINMSILNVISNIFQTHSLDQFSLGAFTVFTWVFQFALLSWFVS